MKVVILGSGNVATALAKAISHLPGKGCQHSISGGNPASGAAKDIELVQIYARNSEQGERLAAAAGTEYTGSLNGLARADLYIIAVSDSAVAEVAAGMNLKNGAAMAEIGSKMGKANNGSAGDVAANVNLTNSGVEALLSKIPETAVIAHTAGSIGIEALLPHTNRAVIYPLQTFTKGREVDFSLIPIFIEFSTPHARQVARDFAESLSRQVWEINSEIRARVHLAAVFASNFSNHMYAVADEILNSTGLPFEIVKPLIAETTAKALAAHFPSSVQTGPAVRGDFTTMERHIELLGSMDSLSNAETAVETRGLESGENRIDLLKDIYEKVSQSIMETSNIWETLKKR